MATFTLPSALHGSIPSLLGVHHYEDAFEKMTRLGMLSAAFKGRLRGKINPAILDKKLLFIHVPKNAGTSIASAVYGYSPPHRTAHFYQAVAGDFFRRAESFAVLRDPVERFLSAYWFIRNGGGEDVTVDPAFLKLLDGVETIDHLLGFVERNLGYIYDIPNVLRPQWWYVFGRSGELLPRRLFILETDQEELADFLKAFGASEIPFKNRTKKGAATVTDEQVDSIRRLYARDVRLIETIQAARMQPSC